MTAGGPRALVEDVIRAIPLAEALGVRCLAASEDAVELALAPGPRATNHLGTVYAGASFTLAEVTGGAAMALLGRGGFVPVLVAARIDYTAPATAQVTCASRLAPGASEVLAADIARDRRTATEVTVECTSGGAPCARATFRYRWLSPRSASVAS